MDFRGRRKEIIGFLIIILCVLAIILCLFELTEIKKEGENDTIRITETRIEWNSIANDMDIIKNVARKYVNNHEYIRDEFDCTQFSWGLKELLGELGYRTRVKLGYIDNNFNYCFEKYRYSLRENLKISKKECPKDYNNAHSWLELTDFNVDLEATSGKIIEN